MVNLMCTVVFCIVSLLALADAQWLTTARPWIPTISNPPPTAVFPTPSSFTPWGRSAKSKRVAPNGAVCPVCSNPYDPTTCDGLMQCGDGMDMCELQIHTQDLFRLDYICSEYALCHSHEFYDCSPTHEMCVYCCDYPESCRTQREFLFNGTYPTFSPPNTPAPSTTPATGSSVACQTCGDYARNIPCTTTELIIGTPAACPTQLPYCFASFKQNGTGLDIFRGCAESNFCRIHWDLNNQRPDCQNPDLTADQQLTCTYCCKDNDCNNKVVPDQNSWVTFP